MEIQKELNAIAWDVPESTYRQDPALSYSTLARYDREGYDKLDSLFESISTPSLTEGSMVDCLITGSQEEFNELFHVADFPSIGDKELLVVNELFRQWGGSYPTMEVLPATYILDVANSFEFQKNWKDETRVKVLTERCSLYYRIKQEAGNKTVVSTDTYEKVIAMVRALKESPVTCGYFADNDPMSPVRRYYQLKFKGTHNKVKYRIMADLIICDYEEKKVIPCDLKTSGHKEWHFENSFEQYRYMIQARLYWRLIRANMDKDPYFKDFTLENYRFIVVNKNSLTPLVWEFPLTNIYGTLVDEEGTEFRDPFEIGEELQAYLNNRPPVPKGISVDGLNTISCLKLKE